MIHNCIIYIIINLMIFNVLLYKYFMYVCTQTKIQFSNKKEMFVSIFFPSVLFCVKLCSKTFHWP